MTSFSSSEMEEITGGAPAGGVVAPEIRISRLTLAGVDIGWDVDGYVDCQALATACGTTMQSYEKSKKNARFLARLALELQLPIHDLIRKGTRGHNSAPRTCHPEVAVDLARWANPEIAVELSGVLVHFLTGQIHMVHGIAANMVRLSMRGRQGWLAL